MRAILILLLMTGAAAAEPCQFGTNRPAIDTMTRNHAPGANVATCTQREVPMTRPDGSVRPMRVWSFDVKPGDRR